MFKKIINYLFKSPEEIGFDNYLVLIITFIASSIGLLGTIIDIVLQMGTVLVILTTLSTIIFISVYFFSRIKNNNVISKYILTLLFLIILNIQWIINYGSTGPIIYLFILLESFIIIFYVKGERLFFTVLVFINVTALFAIEYYHPLIFGKYENNSVRLIDLYTGIIFYLCLSIFLLNLALKYYQSQNEKAQLADKLKSAFLANMSHEIRTPMNGILGFSELLKKPNLSGEEQQKYISMIEKSGVRMLNIINDIIDISKIESGLMEMDIKESNINEQITYIYTFFKSEAEAKGLQLYYKNTLHASESILKTDREKIFAILTNLVKNAIKYSNEGFIEFGYERKDKYLEFFVKDTGIGIPLSRQEAIFERFVQVDYANKMARQGAGLGLSITKAYVEMLGGKIWVKSEEGKGSTFYFTIPYRNEPEIKHQKTNDVTINQKNQVDNLKILIAEDDETSEVLISIMINTFAKQIINTQTGIETIEACRKNPDIDLILMDIQMPEINGFEAIKKIREFNKDVIIIAQTAYGLVGDKDKALLAGCNDYISKPINQNELQALIHKYFRKTV